MNTPAAPPAARVTYRYPWVTRLFVGSMYVIAVLMPLFLFSTVFLRGLADPSAQSPGAIIAVLINGLLGAAVLVMTANFFPEISADAEGLQVSFLWTRLPVPWTDIIEAKPSFFNLPDRPTTWVVTTYRLTPFHRLYGLLYGLKNEPSFIIRYELEGREDLLRRIKRRKFE